MKELLNATQFFYAAVLSVIMFITLTPLPVFAEVVPLAPLPTNFGSDTNSLPGYINTVFYTIIAVGAVLAVLRIVWGGFQYMTSEAITQTKDARTIITMAIVGLILLLASWLILYVINPDLTELKSLSFEPIGAVTTLSGPSIATDGSLTSGGSGSTGDAAAWPDDQFFDVRSQAFGDTRQSWMDVTDVNNRKLNRLSEACTAKGSSYSSEILISRTCKATSSGTRYGEQVAAGEEYQTSYSGQILFGSDGLGSRCNPGDELVKRSRTLVCKTSI